MELLERAKKVMGEQFNETAWKNLIELDSKKAEEKIKELEKILNGKSK